MKIRNSISTQGKKVKFKVDEDYYTPENGDKSLVFNGLCAKSKYCVAYTKVKRDCGTHMETNCLSYEEDSPLDRLRASGRITPQSDETCAAMFDRMNDRLRSAGFEHYEISNFCRPGYYSRHNSSYWDGTPYLGVGAGAHSYDGRSRQWNPSDLDSYMTGVEQGDPRYEIEQLSATDRFNEMVMLRLRTAQGLDLKKLSGLDRERLMQSSRSLIDSGSLQVEGDRLSIPESRMFISDSIISSLFRD